MNVVIRSADKKYYHFSLELKSRPFTGVFLFNIFPFQISSNEEELSNIMRDMKSFTSTSLRKTIVENSQESQRDWMLKMMITTGSNNKNNKDFQFWQQHSHPILLHSNNLIDQKLKYIHNNPVKAGVVENPEDYIYSSAKDYAGIKGMIDIELIE